MKSIKFALSPIGRRLLMTLLLVGSGVTISSTSFWIWLDYREGIVWYQDTINKIASSYQPSIAYSLWAFDYQQLNAQLQGIMNFSGITYVQIDKNGEVLLSQGDVRQSASTTVVVPLHYTNNGHSHQLGYLRINQSYQDLYDALYRRTLDSLSSQLLLFLVASLIIIWVLHRLVTHRLGIMAKWALNFRLEHIDAPLEIHMDDESEDEFSQVAAAINHMRERLKSDLNRRQQEQAQLKQVQNQLALAVDNANLGLCRYFKHSDTFECNAHFATHLGLDIDRLKHLNEPMNVLFEKIQGDNRFLQIERIKQVINGHAVHISEQLHLAVDGSIHLLDLSVQVLSFNDNQPQEVLICSLDRTFEYQLSQQLLQQENEHQQHLEQYTLQCQEEKKTLIQEKLQLEKEVRQLKISQQPKHIQALSELMWQHIQQWQPAIQSTDYSLWQNFLTTNLYKKLEPLNLGQLIIKLTEHSIKPYGLPLYTISPQGIIIEENIEVLSLLMDNLLSTQLLQKAQDAHLHIRLEPQKLHCQWKLTGDFNEEGIEDLKQTLAFQLASIIAQVRLAGNLELQVKGKQLELLLTTPLRA